jgi:hypothetical protein
VFARYRAASCVLLLLAHYAIFAGNSVVSAQAAQPSAVTLTWRAPDSCPQKRDVLREINRLLGDAPRFAQPLLADARITRRSGAFELILRLQSTGAPDERTLSTASCRTAADTAALLIAIAIDPSIELGEPTAAGATAAADDGVGELPQAHDSELLHDGVIVVPATAAVHWELGAGLVLDTVLLPHAAVSPMLRAGLAFRALHVALTASYLPEQTARPLRGAADVYGDIDAYRVALSACYLAPVGALDLGPCVEAGSADVRATPHALVQNSRAGARADFAGAALMGNIRLAPSVYLAPALGVSMVLRRPVFSVSGAGTLHQPRALGASAAVACVFQFE